jgi:Fe-S oxidoreductase
VAQKTNLNLRRYIREVAALNKLNVPSESELWSCTTCSSCSERCPKDLSPLEFLIDIRGMAVEEGQIAPTIRDALESIFKNGNPWARPRSKRDEWMTDLNVKHISQGAEILYFVGCTSAYDPSVRRVAKSIVNCFQKGGLDFGVLGNEENCCGSEAYSVGEKGLFDYVVEENTKAFRKYNINSVVTGCPHGFHVFKNRYNQANLEVQHHSQMLSHLIDKGKIVYSKEINKKIIFHDPCFLGKQNKVFDEPRKVIESVPGVKLLEFDRSKSRSICCEGGGGRMWVDIPGPRLAETRICDAVEQGAEILAVACPFCLLAFEDAAKNTGNEDKIQVMDIAELVSQAL